MFRRQAEHVIDAAIRVMRRIADASARVGIGRRPRRRRGPLVEARGLRTKLQLAVQVAVAKEKLGDPP